MATNPKLKAEIVTEFDPKGAKQAEEAIKRIEGAVKLANKSAAESADVFTSALEEQAKGAERSALEFQAVGKTSQAVGGQYEGIAKRMAAGTDDVTIRTGQLKSALKGLAFEFPMLAKVARLAMNPISLGVTAVVLAVNALQKSFARLQEALKPGGGFASTAKVWEDHANAVKQAQLESLAYERSLLGVVNVMEKAADSTALLTAGLNAQSKALDQIQEAEKGIALLKIDRLESENKLTGPQAQKQRESIDADFAKRKLDRQNKESQEAISIKDRERKSIRENLPRLREELEQVETQIAASPTPGLTQGLLLAAQQRFAAAKQQRIARQRALAENTAPGGDKRLRQALASDEEAEAQALADLQSQAGDAFQREDSFNQLQERKRNLQQQINQSIGRDLALGQELSVARHVSGVEGDTRTQMAKLDKTATLLQPEARSQAVEIFKAAQPRTAEGFSVLRAVAEEMTTNTIHETEATLQALVELIRERTNSQDLTNQQIRGEIDRLTAAMKNNRPF